MMVRMAYSEEYNAWITLWIDIERGKTIELYRIFSRANVTLLDFHNLYKPMRKIGQGLTATVYLVNRNCDNQTFAVKAFKKSTYFASARGKGEVF